MLLPIEFLRTLLKPVLGFKTTQARQAAQVCSSLPPPLAISLSTHHPHATKVDTSCTALSLITSLNDNTVRNFPTHGQQSAAKGSSTVSGSQLDIRLIEPRGASLDTHAQLGLGVVYVRTIRRLKRT